MSSTLICCLVGIIGGWIFGYNTTIIGGLSTPLVNGKYYPDPTSVEDLNGGSTSEQAVFQGLLTAEILLGAFFGAFLGPWIATRYGRLAGMHVCGGICFFSCIGLAFVTNFELLILFRTILGISVGFTCTVCPMYVSENAPEESKDRLGTVFQIAICASILIAQVVNYVMNPTNGNDMVDWIWQFQFGLGAIPGGLLILLAGVIPESKAFLISKSTVPTILIQPTSSKEGLTNGNKDNFNGHLPEPFLGNEPNSSSSIPTSFASTSRVGIRGGSVRSLDRKLSNVSLILDNDAVAGWSALFSRKNLIWPWLGFILSAADQLTGINAIIFYAPNIFAEAGFQDYALILSFSAVGGWNLLAVFASYFLVDRFTRKTLMISTLFAMGISTLLVGCYHANLFPIGGSYIAIFAIVLYVGAFECGTGPLFWMMAVELYPPSIAAPAMSWANATSWTFNILVSFFFPPLQVGVGIANTFFLLAFITLLSICAIYIWLPPDKLRHEQEDKDDGQEEEEEEEEEAEEEEYEDNEEN